MTDYDARDTQADCVQNEWLEVRSEWDNDIHHEVLGGAPKATFHHIGSQLDSDEGWLVKDGTYFAWPCGPRSYSTYSLKTLVAGSGVQYVCTGCTQVPIGFAVVETNLDTK
jgi:hypothetical protein